MMRAFPEDAASTAGASPGPGGGDRDGGAPGTPMRPAPVWVSLVDPSDEEVKAAASLTGLRVPPRADLEEIETTSRMYLENGAFYLSATLLQHVDMPDGSVAPVGFVLSPQVLLTIRYAPIKAFEDVEKELAHKADLIPELAFLRLVEVIIDKGADILEHASGKLDAVSRAAFRADQAQKGNLMQRNSALRQALGEIGRVGDTTSHVRDSLMSMGRISAFVAETGRGGLKPETLTHLAAARADLASLSDYEGHLSAKVQFLLDATLGFINIEQNDIVKVLTIVSVVGVPPVLVAGIYGMNFKVMPELGWTFGYPYALALMVASAIAPLALFRWRGWL